DVAVATLLFGPVVFIASTSVTVADPPDAIEPRLHVTTPAATEQLPWLADDDTCAVPATIGSVTVTAVAVSGPALLTVIVYVLLPPTYADERTDCVIDKSATGCVMLKLLNRPVETSPATLLCAVTAAPNSTLAGSVAFVDAIVVQSTPFELA